MATIGGSTGGTWTEGNCTDLIGLSEILVRDDSNYSGCSWSGNNLYVWYGDWLFDATNKWRCIVQGTGSPFSMVWYNSAHTDCPPATGWVFQSALSTCTGSPTLTIANALDILPAARRVTWQGNVGISGGIPSVTTQHGSTIAAGASLSTVQSALDSCPSGQFVQLSAGNYTFTSDLYFTKNGVVLRGAGPSSTIITFSSGQFKMKGGFSEAALSVDADLSIDAVKGDNVLTLSSVPSWVTVGQLIGIDQLDDASFVHNGGSQNNGASYREDVGNGARGLAQLARVTAKTSTTITVELPLFYGWKVSQTAQIWQPYYNPSTDTPLTLSGVEDLQITASYSGHDMHMVTMESADSCWFKNVEINNIPGGSAIWPVFAYRCEFRHCTIHDSHRYDAGQGYGISPWHVSTACLIEDNIFYDLHVSMGANAGASGNVFAYNYEFGGISDSSGKQNPAISAHSTHTYMNLWEGNYCVDKALADWTHGSSSHSTVFRNCITGTNAIAGNLGDSQTPVSVQYYSRYWNIVGNVLGTTGLQNKYLTDNADTTVGSEGSIFKIGTDDLPSIDVDSYTSGAFILIHGNWDSVNNAITYESGQANHFLPNSYYVSSKPSFFGALNWPPFDPTNPGAASPENIPAGYRWVHGVDP